MRVSRRRLAAILVVALLVLGATWAVYGAWFGAPGDPSTALRCLGLRCTGDVVACVRDPECNAWLTCIQECNGEPMKCPTFCGAYFQSPRATAFLECGLKNECIHIDFSSLPACGAPSAPAVPLEGVDGTWWVAGIKGPDYVLFDDCQRFILTDLGTTELRAQNSVPLTRNGQTRIAKNEGRFSRTDGGVMQLVYENYAGYRERWHFTHRFANSMLAYVCSVSSGQSHDYGAFILARVPVAELPADERAALEAALRDVYRLELADLKPLKMVGCPNP
jgi:hypothetical protein